MIPAILLDHVTFTYPGMDTPALKDICISIPAGTTTAVLGCNGSGKSTLTRHINGLLHPQQGNVFVSGKNIARLDTADIAPMAGLVFQHPDHQIVCSDVETEIAFGPKNLNWDSNTIRAHTEEALRLFHLEPYRQAPPSLLSLGLRKKICLAGVYAMNPSIYILDEPTASLDYADTQLLMDLLTQWHSAGKTILMVTHDLRTAAAYTEYCLLLDQGTLLAYGPTRQILSRRDLLETAHLKAPSIVNLSQQYCPARKDGPALTVSEFIHDQYIGPGGSRHDL